MKRESLCVHCVVSFYGKSKSETREGEFEFEKAAVPQSPKKVNIFSLFLKESKAKLA